MEMVMKTEMAMGIGKAMVMVTAEMKEMAAMIVTVTMYSCISKLECGGHVRLGILQAFLALLSISFGYIHCHLFDFFIGRRQPKAKTDERGMGAVMVMVMVMVIVMVLVTVMVMVMLVVIVVAMGIGVGMIMGMVRVRVGMG